MGHAVENLFLCDLEHGGRTFHCWKMKESSEDTASATSLQIPKTSLTLRPATASETYEHMAKLFLTKDNTVIICLPKFLVVKYSR